MEEKVSGTEGVTMVDGKHCPACGRDIGIWAVFAAGLPNRIRCPHCSARLSYRGIIGVVFVLLLALAGAVAGGWYTAAAIPGVDQSNRPIVAVGIMLGIWVLVELTVVLFLRSKRILVRACTAASSPSEPD